jgi:hypothetical protein
MWRPSLLVLVPAVVLVWLLALVASRGPAAITDPRTWDARSVQAANQDDDDEENANSNANANSNNNANANTNNNNNNANLNDNVPSVNVVPVVLPAPAPPPPPSGAVPVTGVDQVSQCLSNGGTLVYQGPEGGIAVRSYQDNLNVTLTRVDPAAQAAPPAMILSTYIFRMGASPCGGQPYTVLPIEVNLAVSYTEALAAGRDESRFALMYYDGTTWSLAPKLVRDAANNHVSASVTGLGVYALVQQ